LIYRKKRGVSKVFGGRSKGEVWWEKSYGTAGTDSVISWRNFPVGGARTRGEKGYGEGGKIRRGEMTMGVRFTRLSRLEKQANASLR